MEPIHKVTYVEYHNTDDKKTAALIYIGTNNTVEYMEKIFETCIQADIEIIHIANATDEIKDYIKGFESSVKYFPNYNEAYYGLFPNDRR
ncbi:hypothetical protein ACG9XS_20910 [Acinetobacter gyllenbergii]|uniref:hypothetical protein n=1 Tax=Acinetobacter gyllenbergii TaxID=134534 RepID=UPI0003BE973C|nr:hypothetical protein [Acinetobacter gyllenbergii]ESK35402.1 hypothetical protein F987_04314 [Acinetobacter gyllenbergii NIPH 230]